MIAQAVVLIAMIATLAYGAGTLMPKSNTYPLRWTINTGTPTLVNLIGQTFGANSSDYTFGVYEETGKDLSNLYLNQTMVLFPIGTTFLLNGTAPQPFGWSTPIPSLLADTHILFHYHLSWIPSTPGGVGQYQLNATVYG